MRRIPLIVSVLVLAVAGVLLALVARRDPVPAAAPVHFTLTGHHGRPVTEADLAGRPVLLYFGYTFCPDVCPTELGYVARVLRALGPEAAQVQPVMVTIDPARDTVAKLADYVPLYHERLLGLTGTPEQVAALAGQFGVHYQRANVATAKPGYYLMDHTATTFLLDRQGRLAVKIDSHTVPVETAAAEIRSRL
jgi:protein SCO1/2